MWNIKSNDDKLELPKYEEIFNQTETSDLEASTQSSANATSSGQERSHVYAPTGLPQPCAVISVVVILIVVIVLTILHPE